MHAHVHARQPLKVLFKARAVEVHSLPRRLAGVEFEEKCGKDPDLCHAIHLCKG